MNLFPNVNGSISADGSKCQYPFTRMETYLLIGCLYGILYLFGFSDIDLSSTWLSTLSKLP